MPYLRALSSFRDKVRNLAITGALNTEILALSDELRDVQLVDLGVVLDDQAGQFHSFHLFPYTRRQLLILLPSADGRALPKLVIPEILRRARDEKEKVHREKADQKAAVLAALELKRLERVGKGKVAPSDLFRTVDYSAWDDNGIPTKNRVGEDLPKSKTKKLIKEWEVQKKCVSFSVVLARDC